MSGSEVRAENIPQGTGLGREGGNEFEPVRGGGPGLGGEPALKGQRLGNRREQVLSALLARFQCGAPPFLGFALAGVDDGVAGDEGLDRGDAEFDGFLDDEVHVFAFRNGLGQGDDG